MEILAQTLPGFFSVAFGLIVHVGEKVIEMELMGSSLDIKLVLFSSALAVLAAYTTLDLLEWISRSRGWVRFLWVMFGSLVMGIGVWSMHFVGMLSFSMAMGYAYNFNQVLLSFIAAVAASAFALHLAGRFQPRRWRLAAGSLFLAAGIVAMHFIGMSAMLGTITYHGSVVLLSVLIALAASYAALELSCWAYQAEANGKGGNGLKLCSGLLLGAGAAAAHYAGLIGARFQAAPYAAFFDGAAVLRNKWMAYVILGGTVLTLGCSLVSLIVSRKFVSQQSKLLRNEKMLRTLYENNQDGIVTIDSSLRVIGINRAAAQIFRVSPGEYLNCPVSSLVAAYKEEEAALWGDFLNAEQRTVETRVELHNRAQIDVHLMTVPLELEKQLVGHYIIIRDITAEKRAKEQIRYLAFHDELTGLDNRRKFNVQLEEMIQSHQGTGRRFAVMVMDMDRFKLINDSLGHMYGDQFLTEMSDRIRMCSENLPISIARLGGDEITVLYQDCDEPEASVLAEELVAVIQQPYRLKDNDFYVTASVGIAMFPDHGQEAAELLKNADAAMYEVKKNGKNGFQFFTDELKQQLQQKVELESDLRKAVLNEEFVLYYQPQFRAGDHAVVGVEALVRWNHPVKGIVGPGQFVPVLEELGLIIELGSWVLRQACIQMKKWHDAGGPLIPVAVNLSSQQFNQTDLVSLIAGILAETGLAPRYLELEITESMMMDPEASSSVLQELNKLGVRISLDDFGTGYSSLSYLKLFPIHKLKIDRSFVRDITSSGSDKAIVSTIISMARHLNMQVIAEGIETKEQLEIVKDTHCEEIQGYYYSKPLPADDVESSFFVPVR